MIVGDFNMHHPQWSGINKEPSSGVDIFLNLVDEFSLDLQLCPGTVTYEARGTQSTLDLVFTTPGITGRIITCDACPMMNHDSDHIPVETTISLKTVDAPSNKRRSWDKVDMTIFNMILTQKLPSLHDCQETNLEQATTRVIEALQEAISQSVPMSRPSQRSLPHFTPECKEACRETNRLRKRWQASRDDEDHQQYRNACNYKKWLISKNLTSCHREKVEQASQDPKGLWKLNKWTKMRGSPLPAMIPALMRSDKSMEEEPSEKAKLFKEVFFPSPRTQIFQT